MYSWRGLTTQQSLLQHMRFFSYTNALGQAKNKQKYVIKETLGCYVEAPYSEPFFFLVSWGFFYYNDLRALLYKGIVRKMIF